MNLTRTQNMLSINRTDSNELKSKNFEGLVNIRTPINFIKNDSNFKQNLRLSKTCSLNFAGNLESITPRISSNRSKEAEIESCTLKV